MLQVERRSTPQVGVCVSIAVDELQAEEDRRVHTFNDALRSRDREGRDIAPGSCDQRFFSECSVDPKLVSRSVTSNVHCEAG